MIDLLASSIEILTHFDAYLADWVITYGNIIYAILFAIIFAETGLVFAPFLPGDSLLFAAGALAGQDVLSFSALLVILFIAAVLGDSLNYLLGRFLGNKLLDTKLLKYEYIDKTNHFYEKYGGKAVILARFMPILRTFVPFVAGIGRMNYNKFSFYNIIGAFLWTFVFIGGGYIFGNLPIIRDNFTIVIFGVIIISLLPGVFEYLSYSRACRLSRQSKLPGFNRE